MAFAEGTKVTQGKTRAEIEDLLAKNGAEDFISSTSKSRCWIAFRMKNRLLRFDLPMPDPKAQRFTHKTRVGKYDITRTPYTPDQAKAVYEAEIRRLWRALLLAVKAKLEVVASGISSFDREFLAHIVVDEGKTIGEYLADRLDKMSENATLALPAHGEGDQP